MRFTRWWARGESRRRSGRWARLGGVVFLGWCGAATAQDVHVVVGSAHIMTYHNDNARTGRYDQESYLAGPTPTGASTADKAHFGKVFSLPVDGDVYAQPLFLAGVPIGTRNIDVVYVATQRDSVYAFDASNGHELWRKSFLNEPTVTTIKSGDVSCNNIDPEVGITGTPVIGVTDERDLTTGTLYFVTKTKETIPAGGSACVQRLHAIDVVKGDERPGSPKLIGSQTIGGGPIQTVSIRGAGTGLDVPSDDGKPGDNDGNGNVQFFALTQNQRAGLLLSQGVVYVSWASHCDNTPYHGWLMGFEAKSLALASVFNTTPNSGRGGIWQSGAAPAADAAGNLYCSTGNGTFDPELNRQRHPKRGDYGDSILKLGVDPTTTPAAPSPNGWGLKVVDYFTPFDETSLGVAPQDFDLGSGGVLLLDDAPATAPLLVLAGKKGVIYLLNRNLMGQFHPDGDFIAQRIPPQPWDVSILGDVFGMPAVYNSTLYFAGAPRRNQANGPVNGPESSPEPLKGFPIQGRRINPTPSSSSGVGFAMHTHAPAISSNGNQAGIVWMIRHDDNDGPAILHAFDAADLGRELYNSEDAQVGGMPRDRAGVGLKFTLPMIAKGRVFVGTKGEVTVYGKLTVGAKTYPQMPYKGPYITDSEAVSGTGAATATTPGSIVYTLSNGVTTITGQAIGAAIKQWLAAGAP